MIVLGMMSGTSGDGIDTVITELFGIPPQIEWRILSYDHVPFSPELREEIFACFRPETGTVDRICKLNFALSEAYAEAALHAIRSAGMQPNEIDLIGNHGQTLWHIPAGNPQASTLQIGDPAVIAERTGIPVVSNFRTADMAAGGNGAPLVPFADSLLLRSPDKVRAAQNIGGIGNVTYIPKAGDPVHQIMAFDTGPGNMLIDYAAGVISGGKLVYDRDAELAGQGTVNEDLLNELLQHPYFAGNPPKTTGRETFGIQYGQQILKRAAALEISDHDLLATLTMLTARSIADAYRAFLPEFPDEVIVSGGGARNPLLMQMLRELLAPAKVLMTDDFGIPSEAKEALAFAMMAYETRYQRPGNIPSATGAHHPVIMGSLTFPMTGKQSAGELPITEKYNQKSTRIDEMSPLGLAQTINDEDCKVAEAVGTQIPAIAAAIEAVSDRVSRGGRMIYLGAGTSGRLGVLDASEMPPTYGVSPELVVGRIAGGMKALIHAVEGAEDDPEGGKRDIEDLQINENDSVVGLSASGNAPYVIGGLEEARRRGALTIAVACNQKAAIAGIADIAILPEPGPEVISGSTRMKSGTAQKLVLNMLSTGVMIMQGKTYGNLMIDLEASNKKLVARKRRLTASACGISEEEAQALLDRCSGNIKCAIVVHYRNVEPLEAMGILNEAKGYVKRALS